MSFSKVMVHVLKHGTYEQDELYEWAQKYMIQNSFHNFFKDNILLHQIVLINAILDNILNIWNDSY